MSKEVCCLSFNKIWNEDLQHNGVWNDAIRESGREDIDASSGKWLGVFEIAYQNDLLTYWFFEKPITQKRCLADSKELFKIVVT